MSLLRISGFGGEVPVQGMRALPDAFATQSVNTWLYSQELRGLHPSDKIRNLIPTTKKVFRIPRGTVGGDPANPTLVPPPSYLGDSTWLEFNDPDTDIVRGPLVNDSYKRWYTCSPSAGPRFNTLARLIAGEGDYKLGVPNPAGTLSVIVTGGSATDNVTRAYLYTNVNIYGEESGPSEPVTAAGKADGTWEVSGIADPTTEFTDFAPFDHKVLYRSITGNSGVTTFYKVAEIPAGTTTYDDTMPDTVLAGQLAFENTNGTLPPENLQGFIAMPNGFMVGWVDSDVYFSEPYKPYSWPPEYVVSTEYPIVGLGVFGQTCALMTKGFPCTLQGITPATTALSKTNVLEPCLSRGSIISTPQGVFYASQNGLVSISSAGINVVTQTLITREEWSRDYAPAYLRAARYMQGYLAVRAVPTAADRTAFYLDLSDLRTAVTELSEFDNCENVQGDVWSSEVFAIRNAKVEHYDAPGPEFLPFIWRSKEFQYPFKNNFGAYMVFWDQDRADLTSGSAVDIMPADVPINIKVWADRELVYDQPLLLTDNAAEIRLPSGFKAQVWQFEIRGRAPVFALHVASTIKELRGA